jgi:hypothetical protein
MITKVNIRDLEVFTVEAVIFGDIRKVISLRYNINQAKVQLRKGRRIVDTDYRTLADYHVRPKDIIYAEILDESIVPNPAYMIVEFSGTKDCMWLAVWPSDTITDLKRELGAILHKPVRIFRMAGADLPDDTTALRIGISQWSTIDFFLNGETIPLPEAMFSSSPNRHMKLLPKPFRRCNSCIAAGAVGGFYPLK